MDDEKAPDSLENKLRAAAEEITALEKKLDDAKKQARELGLYAGLSIMPGAKETHKARIQLLEDMEQKLRDARQKQTALLLDSISQSSNRLEVATRNLQQSSESQLKVAESQTELSRSQVKVMKDLLKSSHLLEQFTVYLMVLTGLSIFLVEYTQGLFNGSLGVVGAVGLIGAILAMFILGGYLPRLRKLDKGEP